MHTLLPQESAHQHGGHIYVITAKVSCECIPTHGISFPLHIEAPKGLELLNSHIIGVYLYNDTNCDMLIIHYRSLLVFNIVTLQPRLHHTSGEPVSLAKMVAPLLMHTQNVMRTSIASTSALVLCS